jgi:hypothetical protein
MDWHNRKEIINEIDQIYGRINALLKNTEPDLIGVEMARAQKIIGRLLRELGIIDQKS